VGWQGPPRADSAPVGTAGSAPCRKTGSPGNPETVLGALKWVEPGLSEAWGDRRFFANSGGLKLPRLKRMSFPEVRNTREETRGCEADHRDRHAGCPKGEVRIAVVAELFLLGESEICACGIRE